MRQRNAGKGPSSKKQPFNKSERTKKNSSSGDKSSSFRKDSPGGRKSSFKDSSDRKKSSTTPGKKFIKSFKKDNPSEKNDFSDKKESGGKRKDYSDKKESGFRRKEYTDKKESGFKRKDYSDRKEPGFKRKDSSDKKESGFKRKNFSDKKESGFKREKREGSFTKKGFTKGPRKEFDTPSYDLKKHARGKNEAESPSDQIRLNKYIANAGVCSRRDADQLIGLGEITVNGNVVTELGFKVNKGDVVKYNNKVISAEKPVYILLNKPKDFITTTDDPQERKTVMNLVQNACKERIYPVGRLDRNTTGLLLLTNDGELAKKLTHPSGNVKKLYQADLDKPLAREDFEKILNGVELEDGLASVDTLAYVTPDKRSIGIEIHIGKNRIVRRIFEHLGYEVVRLDRVMFAGLTKKDLPRGKWRFLNEKEVIQLKYFL